jgi:putative NADPH-quinone reductase
MSVLVIYAHSDPDSSRYNRALVHAALSVKGVTVHDLARAYPDFRIDCAREAELLSANETIVLQFPMHWYSVPAIAKKWLDDALAYGFAYGPGGTHLNGKRFWLVCTISGAVDSYGGAGKQPFDVRYSLDCFFAFLEQTVRVCGMKWESPFIVDRVIWDGLNDAELAAYAEAYATRLKMSLLDAMGDS